MKRLLWLVIAGLAGCYQSNPNLASGIVLCGGTNGLCPAGLLCGCDNRCHVAQVQCDAGPTDGPMSDSSADAPMDAPGDADPDALYNLTVRAFDTGNPAIQFCMASTLSKDSTVLYTSGPTPAEFFGTTFTRALHPGSYTVSVTDYMDIMFDHWDNATPCANRTIRDCAFTLNGDLLMDAWYTSDPFASRSSCTTQH